MLFAIVAVLILIADQWLKYWVTVNITLATGSQELIPGAVKLVNIHNSGAAFGMLENVEFARWIFLGVTAVFVVVIAVLLIKRVFDSRFAVWCEVLFLTGALGNCIDRVFLGYVVDMFKLEFVNFAVFNIADAVLVVSCLMFIIYVFFGSRSEYDDEEEEDDEPIRVRPVARSAPETADDFADLFGLNSASSTASKPEDKPAQQEKKETKLPPEHDAFWDDFGPMLRREEKAADNKAAAPAAEKTAAPAAKADIAPEKASEETVSYDLEDILAEFRDL